MLALALRHLYALRRPTVTHIESSTRRDDKEGPKTH